jgi:hypothetical protein
MIKKGTPNGNRLPLDFFVIGESPPLFLYEQGLLVAHF